MSCPKMLCPKMLRPKMSHPTSLRLWLHHGRHLRAPSPNPAPPACCPLSLRPGGLRSSRWDFYPLLFFPARRGLCREPGRVPTAVPCLCGCSTHALRSAGGSRGVMAREGQGGWRQGEGGRGGTRRAAGAEATLAARQIPVIQPQSICHRRGLDANERPRGLLSRSRLLRGASEPPGTGSSPHGFPLARWGRTALPCETSPSPCRPKSFSFPVADDNAGLRRWA